jgi:hypothetical protein
MKHSVEMGSSAMIYTPSFRNIESGIEKLMWGIHTQTHRYQADLISLLLFYQNTKVG